MFQYFHSLRRELLRCSRTLKGDARLGGVVLGYPAIDPLRTTIKGSIDYRATPAPIPDWIRSDSQKYKTNVGMVAMLKAANNSP